MTIHLQAQTPEPSILTIVEQTYKTHPNSPSTSRGSTARAPLERARSWLSGTGSVASWNAKLVENGEIENGHLIVSPSARDSIARAHARLTSSDECAPSPGLVYMSSMAPPS